MFAMWVPALTLPAPLAWRWIAAPVLAVTLAALPTPRSYADPPSVTAEAVDTAIERSVAWLYSQRKPTGHWEPADNPDERYWGGFSGLALLALLYAGEDARQDQMAHSLDWLTAQKLKQTYVYAIRAHALALAPGDSRRKRLNEDLAWLLSAAFGSAGEHPGAYDYESLRGEKRGRYDNSNSQFGVLGVWMATEAGARGEDLDGYWQRVEKHWLRDQQSDGGWAYEQHGRSSGSMTVAGLATLYVVLDRLHARTGHRRATEVIEAIDRGLDWLGREFTLDNPHGSSGWRHYYLYGVERAGRASGRKYFRDRDWFRLGASELLATQQPDGAWGDLPQTCFALMFLCHGRAPVFFNKLEHGEDWDNYLRDVAGLSRYAGHALERLLNWQIVSLAGSTEDLLESPVLYLSGAKAWQFAPEELLKLQEFCGRGGMIFAVAQDEGAAFSQSMRELAERLFPTIPLRPLDKEHPIFTEQTQFRIEAPPRLFGVTRGARTTMILSPIDLAAAWNTNRLARARRDYQLGCNIYIFATDKASQKTRLDTPTIPLRTVTIDRTIAVARLRHQGEWNSEPHGWERLKAYMNNEASTRLLVTTGVGLDDVELSDFRVAAMSGVGPLRVSDEEKAGLRRFITAGGTLLVDAVGGDTGFADSFRALARELLNVEPTPLLAGAALRTGKGIPAALDLKLLPLRRAVRSDEGATLFTFDLNRRPAILFSTVDVSSGLLGTPIFGCKGYEPAAALRLMRNALLYANLSTAEKAKLAPG